MRGYLLLSGLLLSGLAAIAFTACGGSRAHTEPVRLHPTDVTGMPVLWLGESYDEDGDGVGDLDLTAASLSRSPEFRNPRTGEVIRPEVEFYSMAYGTCKVAEGDRGCPVPITVIIEDPCRAQPLAEGIVYNKTLLRGVEAQWFEAGLRLDTAEFTVTVHAVGDTKSETEARAARAIENLKGANDEAKAFDVGTPFHDPPADRASESGLCENQTAGGGSSYNDMALDADPGAVGMQSTRNVSSGNFTIAIEQTLNPEPFQGFQWQIAFDAGVLAPVSATSNDDGNPRWDSDPTGLTLCAPAAIDTGAPAGTTWFGGGAGCAGVSGVSFTGTLARITLACLVSDGSTTEVRFVAPAESQFDFGSTFLTSSGSMMATDLGPSITIRCGP